MPGEAHRIHAALAQLAEQGSAVGRVADEAVLIWRDLDRVLAPIIGKRGVAALFQRSIFLTRAAYPWLPAAHQHPAPSDEFAALRATLAHRSGEVAVAANGALIRTFSDLLSTLIGESLTERLLASVSAHPTSGNAAQDNLA